MPARALGTSQRPTCPPPPVSCHSTQAGLLLRPLRQNSWFYFILCHVQSYLGSLSAR